MIPLTKANCTRSDIRVHQALNRTVEAVESAFRGAVRRGAGLYRVGRKGKKVSAGWVFGDLPSEYDPEWHKAVAVSDDLDRYCTRLFRGLVRSEYEDDVLVLECDVVQKRNMSDWKECVRKFVEESRKVHPDDGLMLKDLKKPCSRVEVRDYLVHAGKMCLTSWSRIGELLTKCDYEGITRLDLLTLFGRTAARSAPPYSLVSSYEFLRYIWKQP